MSLSVHRGVDQYGHKYSNTVWDFEHDIVVFGCEPPLLFDIKEYGLMKKINKVKAPYDDYGMTYDIKGGALYLIEFKFEAKPLVKPPELFDTLPFKPYPTLRRYYYIFEHQPVDYSGVFRIGKDFDFDFWQGDEKAKPTTFRPEAYKQNGYICFEKGKIVEIELRPRNK